MTLRAIVAIVAVSAAILQPRPVTAVVTGLVVNETGAPMRGVMVTVFVRAIAGYPELTRSGPLAVTDSLGRYRITNISPGRYFVSIPASSQRGSSDAMGYPTTFYPSARSAAEATEVVLKTAEVRDNTNFSLARMPAYRVSGKLTGLERRGPRGASGQGISVAVHLVPSAAPDTPLAFEEAGGVSANDVFSIDRVRPGRYLLRVADFPMRGGLGGIQTNVLVGAPPHGRPLQSAPVEPTLWVETPVEVSDRDVEGLTVALRVGARVSGQVRFEAGAAPDPTLFLGTAVALQWTDNREFGESPIVRIEADGRFTTAGMPLGRYAIRLYPMMKDSIPLPPRFNGAGAWRVAAIRVGDRELAGGEIEIGADDIRDVVIVLRPADK